MMNAKVKVVNSRVVRKREGLNFSLHFRHCESYGLGDSYDSVTYGLALDKMQQDEEATLT